MRIFVTKFTDTLVHNIPLVNNVKEILKANNHVSLAKSFSIDLDNEADDYSSTIMVEQCTGEFTECFDIICKHIVYKQILPLFLFPSSYTVEHLPKNRYDLICTKPEEAEQLKSIEHINSYIIETKETPYSKHMINFIGKEISEEEYDLFLPELLNYTFKECFESLTEYARHNLIQ